MKNRTTRIFSALMATTVLVAAMSVPASARRRSRSRSEQMAANSAAWHVAHAAGDKATCDRLHRANQALAKQAAGSSGSSSYNSRTGTWDIKTSSGGRISSSGSHSGGKSHKITYTDTSSSGRVTSHSDTTYSGSSIDAYKQHGGTNAGLEKAYNNDAAKNTAVDRFAQNNTVTTAQEEATVAQHLLGLSDAETEKLRQDLEASKQAYDSARNAYKAAVAAGNTAAATAAQKQMDAAHKQAQEARAQRNYVGDEPGTHNGGYFQKNPGDPGSGFYGDGGSHIEIATTYEITASCNTGGTINPSGTFRVVKGGSKTYTMTPASGYKVDKVLVDGVSQGSLTTYTFSNVTSAHTISAVFIPSGTIDAGAPSITDGSGGRVDGSAGNDGIKSGYGIFAEVPVSYSDVSDVKVAMIYDFGDGQQSVALSETRSGIFEYPVNDQSPTGKRCVYIPVDTADGSYTLNFSVSAKNAAGETLTDNQTGVVVVNGSMYEDDFTADS